MIIQNVILISNTRGILLQYPTTFSEHHYVYTSIHKICFPESQQSSYNYFTVPSTKSQSPLYGVLILSTQPSTHYISKPENPSENEQIGLIVLTHSPYLHVIKDHFLPLVELYFLQNNFFNEKLLMSIQKTLNLSFTETTYHLPNCCSLINRIGNNFFIVLKMLLLDSKICINNAFSSEINCQWIISLLSFLPGCFFPSPQSLKQIGFKGELKRTLLHCTLSELDLLSNINVFSGTSFLFGEMAEFNLTIGEKENIIASIYKQCITVTKADKQLTIQLLEAAKEGNSDKCYEIILQYIFGLFCVSKIEKKGLRHPIEYEDYGNQFVSEFKKTALFKHLPQIYSFAYYHPTKHQTCPIDFSDYLSVNSIDIQSESSLYYPSYK